MNVLVCGGRNYSDKKNVYFVLDRIASKTNVVIINGEAPGADILSTTWAIERKIEYKSYPAKWEEHGRAAGPIRNGQMIKENKIDLVVAFPGGSGTKDMKDKARKAGIKVLEID